MKLPHNKANKRSSTAMDIITQNKRYLPHEVTTKESAVKLYKLTKDISFVCRQYHISKASLVKTTGIAGGLHWPYKGLRQRHLKVLERFANRISFTGCPPAGGRSIYLPLLTGSPVNGSLYSLSVNWSAAMSSCNWFATYSLIRFSFLPTVST